MDWPIEKLGELVDELAKADQEHGDVDLTHASEWSISYHRNKTAIFENVEEGEPRHMKKVGKAKLLELWEHLAKGDLAWLEKQPWKKGVPERDRDSSRRELNGLRKDMAGRTTKRGSAGASGVNGKARVGARDGAGKSAPAKAAASKVKSRKYYEGETFRDLRLPKGRVFSDAELDRCAFEDCRTQSVEWPYGAVRNVVARKCKFFGYADRVALEDVTIEDLDTGAALFMVTNCVFKHVVLKGKFGKWFLKDPYNDAAAKIAREYYAKVDWALDIRDAEFREIDLRGVPPELLVRNAEVQVAVYRADAMRIKGWEEIPHKAWRGAIARLAGERAFRDVKIFIPETRSANYADQLASVKMLHELGLAM